MGKPAMMTRLQALIHMATKAAGSYEPSRALSHIEEQLNLQDYDEADRFLKWVIATKTTFGWNLPEVWKRWKKETCRHYWVSSGTGLRCLICKSRRRAKIEGVNRAIPLA